MGKIIAVWGTPNSGKTAFTMKLAGHLYETGRRRQTKVVAVLTDVIAPSMPVVFPLYRSEDIYSLGELLAKTTITADDIFSYTTLLRGRENFGVLGYRDKENAHSHPAYTGEKALSFLNILAANTDYVLVDCMSEPEDSTGASAITQVWTYVGEIVFNMLVLVGTVKLSDQVVSKMLGI